MAIPIFEDFLYPFLYYLGQKDMTKKEMKAAIINHFHLSEDDCALHTRGGTTSQINDRLSWTLQYLRRAQFVDIPHRGLYQIQYSR